ncbi:indoleamine 2,3-dioxygenase [Aspergillus sp. HF37]|nr:indoleamine 2,3-dioxygenase [Aspergillus sp. HF37]
MPHSQDSILARYGVSSKNGFLPESVPMQALQDPYYEPWEALATNLPESIKAKTIRSAVDGMPVLSTTHLHDEDAWRRAYTVLGFLAHAYIWGGDKPSEKLPPSITRPFLEVSFHLELPPCATFACLCLWNYAVKPGDGDITNPDNLRAVTSFTGTKDEEWFYMVSVAIEAAGAKLVPLMMDAIDAVAVNDGPRVAGLLTKFAAEIDDIALILARMDQKCSPAAFYHQLRPFLAGSKNMASAGLPKGVFYDHGAGTGEWHEYYGGSNAQSSLIQTFDIFLGVEHTETGGGYLHNMRFYMPGPHRRFLELLTKLTNIRAYVLAHEEHSGLRTSYNAAAMSLSRLRNTHMQLVARYIIVASKSKPAGDDSGRVNIATATSKKSDPDRDEFQGTGGTSLMPFLKQTRDATRECATAKK